MAKHITILVPGKHPQTGELTRFELKGQRIDIDIGEHRVPFLIHGQGIGTALTHIPSGYRIALLGGWLSARYLNPKDKPSRPMCAQLAIDRLVANYGALHLLDRLNVKLVINTLTDAARCCSAPDTYHKQHKGPAFSGEPSVYLEKHP